MPTIQYSAGSAQVYPHPSP